MGLRRVLKRVRDWWQTPGAGAEDHREQHAPVERARPRAAARPRDERRPVDAKLRKIIAGFPAHFAFKGPNEDPEITYHIEVDESHWFGRHPVLSVVGDSPMNWDTTISPADLRKKIGGGKRSKPRPRRKRASK